MVVYSCWCLSTALVDLKYPSSSLHKTSFVDCWYVYFAFIRSAFIDHNNCPRVLLKIVCALYTNHTYRFSFFEVSRKVVLRVTVVWLHLSSSIYLLASRQSYKKLFILVHICFRSRKRKKERYWFIIIIIIIPNKLFWHIKS